MINLEAAERLKELLEEAGTKWDEYIVDCQAEEMEPEVDYYQFLANHLMTNGVIELPCKVGCPVWYVRPLHGEIVKARIEAIVVRYAGMSLKLTCNSMYETSCRNIGKTVFFTRHEAEIAFNKMTEGNNECKHQK